MTQTDPGPPPIRILAIDDHPAILDAIDRAVTECEALCLAGVARDRDSAERLIVELDPDVVVCDVQLGGNVDGLRLLEKFGGRPRPIFLMLSAYDYPSLLCARKRAAPRWLGGVCPERPRTSVALSSSPWDGRFDASWLGVPMRAGLQRA